MFKCLTQEVKSYYILFFEHVTVGCGLEQKTVYFLMMPFTLRGGSQDTNTTEFDAAAAFTPAGGPGTERRRVLVNIFPTLG